MADAEQAEDVSLLAAVAGGDARAFATLARRHHGRAYALAWRVLNNRADAEDVVQEVFVKLWRGADRFDPTRGRFSGFLSRMVVNQCLDRRRQLRPVEDLDVATQIADPHARTDQDAERRALDSVMATLAPRQRAVLALFYLEGYSMVEVAELMATNEKAVESLLSRARAALREKLTLADAQMGGRA